MSGTANDVKSLVDEVRPLAVQAWPFRMMSFTDPAGLLQLSSGWTSQPSYLVPPKTPRQQLRDLIRSTFPPPPADAKPVGDVVMQCAAAIGGTGLSAAMYELEKLSWPDRFKVLDALQADSSLDNMTSLEALESSLSAAQLPDVNPALHPAMIVVLLQTTRRTVNNASIALTFAESFVNLTASDQISILGRLGIRGMAAEGTIALMTGEALASGMVTIPVELQALAEQMQVIEPQMEGIATPVKAVSGGKGSVPMGEWKPNGMPAPFYIGVSAHVAIAEYYRAANKFDPMIWTNDISVDTILQELEDELAFEGDEVEVALGLSRPDIFHFSFTHPSGAPGWVYEIKPWQSMVVAETEAHFYADALSLAGIPTTPGPIDEPGTWGCLPAPAGWFLFTCVAPGALVYWYRRATNEELKAAGKQPADETQLKEIEAALESTGSSAAQVVGWAAVLAALVLAAKALAGVVIALAPVGA